MRLLSGASGSCVGASDAAAEWEESLCPLVWTGSHPSRNGASNMLPMLITYDDVTVCILLKS